MSKSVLPLSRASLACTFSSGSNFSVIVDSLILTVRELPSISKVPYSDITDVIKKVGAIEIALKIEGVSREEYPVSSILMQWPQIQSQLEMVEVKCTDQDFKNYMLVSLILREESKRLRQQLIGDFGDILAQNK